MVFLNSGLVFKGTHFALFLSLSMYNKLKKNCFVAYFPYPCVGFFGMDIRSCIINSRLGWSMGFSRIPMKSFSLRGNCKFYVVLFSFFFLLSECHLVLLSVAISGPRNILASVVLS